MPSDWYSSDNTIEVIGGGGGGDTTSSTSNGRGGGGGGAYSAITNLSLSVGASVTYQVGNGGGPNVGGGATKTSGVSDRSRAHRET